MANFSVEKADGKTIDMLKAGIIVTQFDVSPPSPITATEFITMRDGFLDLGTYYEGRQIDVKCLFKSDGNYESVRNDIFKIFDSRQYFYVISDTEPDRRWKVKYDSPKSIRRAANVGEIDFTLVSPSTYAESLSTTLNPTGQLVNNQGMYDEPAQYTFDAIADATTAPTLSEVANTNSTLTAATYYVQYTWKNDVGETLGSTEASITTTAGYELHISVPAFPSEVTSAGIYVGTATGAGKYQGDITTSGTDYVLTADPSTTGSAVPTANSTLTSFRIWNDGDITVDPRQHTLLIEYSGAATNLSLKNVTNGDEWVYTGSVLAGEVVKLDGVRSLKDGLSIFKDTNGALLTLEPGWNDFEITGSTGAVSVSVDFRFLFI